MINEFAGRVFTCNEEQLEATGPGYTNVSITTSLWSRWSRSRIQRCRWNSIHRVIVPIFPISQVEKLRHPLGIPGRSLRRTSSQPERTSLPRSPKEKSCFSRRGHSAFKKKASNDEEVGSHAFAALEKGATDASAILTRQTAIFHWEDVCLRE